MPQTALTNLGLNYNWDAGEDGWKAGVDNNFVLTDALAQAGLTVEFKSVSVQPPTPVNGAVYILGPSPSGAEWGARDENDIGIFTTATGWSFTTPRDGWAIHDRTDQKQYRFNLAENNWLQSNKSGELFSTGTTYTPVRQDANGWLETNLGGFTFNIPAETPTLQFPVGAELSFLTTNATAANITADPAVLFRGTSPVGTLATDTLLTIRKTAVQNTWAVVRNSAL